MVCYLTTHSLHLKKLELSSSGACEKAQRLEDQFQKDLKNVQDQILILSKSQEEQVLLSYDNNNNQHSLNQM